MRHTRQKYLEEAAVQEADLLQELDRCYIVIILSRSLQLNHDLININFSNIKLLLTFHPLEREQLKLRRRLRDSDCLN